MSFADHRISLLQNLLGDHYRFEAFIGCGASAAVYKVRNLRLDRAEALKVLAESFGQEHGSRFAQEAKVAASLDHPNIIKIYDYGQVSGIFWIAMQFINGPTLNDQLCEYGAMAEIHASGLAGPLLDALEYSHQRGVVHRDIKPANIILDSRFAPYLMDYGIAKAADSMLRTQTGMVLGTPAYVAPEQASGLVLDGRADIYSLAITLYEMLTGSLPFTADGALQALVMRLSEDPEPLSSKRPDINPELEAIVMRALERDPEQRFATASEMRKALAGFCDGADQAPTPPLAKPSTQAIEFRPTVATYDGATVATLGTDTTKTIADRGRSRRFRRWAMAGGGAAIVLLSAVILYLMDILPGSRLDQPGLAVTPSPALRATSTPPPGGGAGEVSLEQPVKDAAATQPRRDQPATPPPAAAGPPPTAEVLRRPVQMPVLLRDVELQGAPSLLETCAGQVVNLSVLVGEDGQVQDARVIGENSEECGPAALAAVRQYIYQPALAADEQPVAARMTLAVFFPEENQ